MNLLLGFAPFVAFAVLAHFKLDAIGLWVSAALASGMLLRSQLPPRRSLKILDAGAAAVFLALAIAVTVLHFSWSVFAVRMSVSLGLFAIAVGSILIGQPFTIQYAREQVPRERWTHPLFIAANRRISAVWAAAFAVDALCSASLVWAPGIPPIIPSVVNVLAFLGAVRFTVEYPKRLRARRGETSSSPA